MKRLFLSLLLVSLMGCDGEDGTRSSGPEPTTSPTQVASPSPSPPPLVTAPPSPTLASACPNEIAVRSDESLRNGGSVKGDVDGDGTHEEVWAVVDDEGGPGCVGFLVVRRADDSLLSTALPFETLFGTFDPRVHALVDLGPLAGYEISAFVGRGASTEFLALYAVSGDTVVQLKINRRPEPERSVFGTYGSVGHLSAIDCVEGHLVVSTAVPSGESVEYRVKRLGYELQGLVLARTGPPQRDRVDADELSGYPEFVSSPLGSCPQA
ncbi:MAG: hypothetical protein GEU78_15300 [Actinobacteria bacterium]|nr:hypothetical protein [Actinomycetota bacterium]